MKKSKSYERVLLTLENILTGEKDPILWMSTVSCLVRENLNFLWVGFYLARQEMLHIGPYQGALACLHIPFGKGVCGTCAVKRETVIVPDVHDFPGHIACDTRARSEIVVPVVDSEGILRAVLDVDSEQEGAFDEVDAAYLEKIANSMADLRWNREN